MPEWLPAGGARMSKGLHPPQALLGAPPSPPQRLSVQADTNNIAAHCTAMVSTDV